jgi:cyclopropane fatty-acyl-phospholipid synthase-like methyltransferase
VLYQSLKTLNILGHRETELRYDLMGLHDIISPQDVILDIGANCGFMLVYAVYRKGCSGDAIDWNPYMLEVGGEVARFLKLAEKIRFMTKDFQDFVPDRKYTVVFSFASHWTTDEGLRLTLRDHLEKCAAMLTDGGTLVFESQGWEYQKPGYYENFNKANEFFDIVETKDMKSMGREGYVMRKR